jgi:hypothetical protein
MQEQNPTNIEHSTNDSLLLEPEVEPFKQRRIDFEDTLSKK